MLSKNEIKYIQSLSDKKTRDEEGVFVAEGVKLVSELLQSDIPVRKIYATSEWVAVHPSVMNVVTVSEAELKKISGLSTPNDVLLIARQIRPLHEPQLADGVTIVLDGIQDPGNLGTIVRIADWFGITQILATTDTADIYNPKVIQATMGSIARVRIWYDNVENWLRRPGIKVFGALLQGNNVYLADKTSDGLLVIGNESKGIRNNLLPFIQYPLTIPKRGGAESLNAAVATGIILSHLLK